VSGIVGEICTLTLSTQLGTGCQVAPTVLCLMAWMIPDTVGYMDPLDGHWTSIPAATSQTPPTTHWELEASIQVEQDNPDLDALGGEILERQPVPHLKNSPRIVQTGSLAGYPFLLVATLEAPNSGGRFRHGTPR